MPSPFPGMDPYLEAPDIWPDFHDALAGEIRAALNDTLPAPYYARLEMRPEIGVVEEGGRMRHIVPDVSVVRRPGRRKEKGGVAVLDAPRAAISESYDITIKYETIRHAFVEIRDSARGHKLITLIEIVSPSNKLPGEDRENYLKKQSEILHSDASMIEIDLLRYGERLLEDLSLHVHIGQMKPPPDYVVLVGRAWERKKTGLGFKIFPVLLQDMLPCIPVPLREGQDEVPLDLQFVFNRAYDRGPYRRGAVDYTQPPSQPLTEEQQVWVADCVREAGYIS